MEIFSCENANSDIIVSEIDIIQVEDIFTEHT